MAAQRVISREIEYKIVTFRIPGEVVAALDRIASEHDRSRNKVVENLLKRGLEDYESDGVLVKTLRPENGIIPIKSLASDTAEAIQSLPDGPDRDEMIGQLKELRTEARAIAGRRPKKQKAR